MSLARGQTLPNFAKLRPYQTERAVLDLSGVGGLTPPPSGASWPHKYRPTSFHSPHWFSKIYIKNTLLTPLVLPQIDYWERLPSSSSRPANAIHIERNCYNHKLIHSIRLRIRIRTMNYYKESFQFGLEKWPQLTNSYIIYAPSGISVHTNQSQTVFLEFWRELFLNTIFVPNHMYPENLEGAQEIVGSMNMGYISDTARNRTHNLFRLKREPIPLRHSDGLIQDTLISQPVNKITAQFQRLYHCLQVWNPRKLRILYLLCDASGM